MHRWHDQLSVCKFRGEGGDLALVLLDALLVLLNVVLFVLQLLLQLSGQALELAYPVSCNRVDDKCFRHGAMHILARVVDHEEVLVHETIC